MLFLVILAKCAEIISQTDFNYSSKTDSILANLEAIVENTIELGEFSDKILDAISDEHFVKMELVHLQRRRLEKVKNIVEALEPSVENIEVDESCVSKWDKKLFNIAQSNSDQIKDLRNKNIFLDATLADLAGTERELIEKLYKLLAKHKKMLISQMKEEKMPNNDLSSNPLQVTVDESLLEDAINSKYFHENPTIGSSFDDDDSDKQIQYN